MSKQKILTILAAGALVALTGCVAVPTGPNGPYAYYPLAAVPPANTYADPRGTMAVPQSYLAQMPAVLQARLYPSNDIAAQTGMVSGTVTNMQTGKGRFQLQYGGELLVGEATRVDGDARRGVASAYGTSGGFMSCEYQMSSPRQGAGSCTFSNGAQYKAHIGL